MLVIFESVCTYSYTIEKLCIRLLATSVNINNGKVCVLATVHYITISMTTMTGSRDPLEYTLQ